MADILQNLLPSNLKLLAYEETRTLSLFSVSSFSIVVQKQFTRNEWLLFMALVENHPHYAPYEILLASVTSIPPDTCRKLLHEAQQTGSEVVKQELMPVYRVVSSLRTKISLIYPLLKVSFVRDAGYVLIISSDTDN